MLHVYYLRKRLVATPAHSLYCIQPWFCRQGFCNSHVALDRQQKQKYGMRFTFQSLLAIRNLPTSAPTHAHQLLEWWKAALSILRVSDNLKQLDSDQVRLYSSCSDNPIFNDAISAILSEAVSSYLHPESVAIHVWKDWKCYRTSHYAAHPPTFWVALSACVLGDLPFFATYTSRLTLPVEINSLPRHSESFFQEQLSILLEVAIEYSRLRIVRYLLEQHPNIKSDVHSNHALLRAAIFSNNNEVLEAVLEYTPSLPDLLTSALDSRDIMLPRSSSGAETIRLLTRHFSPLSAEARAWLILHSCAVGDITLLEGFSKTQPLFSHLIYDAGGRVPTYANFAIRCGNVDTLCFLLDHGLSSNMIRGPLRFAIEQSLSFNQIHCYRELYQRYDEPRSIRSSHYVTLAENAEELMAEFIYEHEHKDLILECRGDRDDQPLPTPAETALCNAIQRLRPGNIRFLLGAGVRPFPWRHSSEYCMYHDDTFEIRWPYYNQNRDAFLHTQEVLDAFALPKLRIIV